MSKETALAQYSEFEKEDSKRFASPAPLVFTMLATNVAATSLYAFGGTETLSHALTSPEGIIPTGIVYTAAAISFVRSVRKDRNLNKITIEIAKEEERALLQDLKYEKYRTRRILHLSRLISPLPFDSPDFKERIIMLVGLAHKTATVLRNKKPVKFPQKGSGKTIGDVMQKDQDTEVAQIVKTAASLAIPGWVEYSKEYLAAGIEINEANEALAIIKQNSAL